MKFDLESNKLVQSIPFGADICPAKSYLNDVRVDTGRQIAYLTESGVGCIVVVDLKSGKARRTLVEDESTVYDKKVDLTINGKEVETAEKQKPKFNADGIALSPDDAYLYYQPVLSGTLYRVATEKLRDEKLSKGELSKAVEKVGASFPVRWFLDGQGGVSVRERFARRSDPAAQGAGWRGRVGVCRPAHPVAGFAGAGGGRGDLFFVFAHTSRAAVQRRQERAHGAVHDFQGDALIVSG